MPDQFHPPVEAVEGIVKAADDFLQLAETPGATAVNFMAAARLEMALHPNKRTGGLIVSGWDHPGSLQAAIESAWTCWDRILRAGGLFDAFANRGTPYIGNLDLDDLPARVADDDLRELERSVRVLRDELALLGVHVPAPTTGGAHKATSDLEPPVALGGLHENPLVCGKRKPPLTDAQYRSVEALLSAYPEGLTKDALETACTSGRAVLAELVKEPDWKRVIRFPKKPGAGGYRIVAPKR